MVTGESVGKPPALAEVECMLVSSRRARREAAFPVQLTYGAEEMDDVADVELSRVFRYGTGLRDALCDLECARLLAAIAAAQAA